MTIPQRMQTPEERATQVVKQVDAGADLHYAAASAIRDAIEDATTLQCNTCVLRTALDEAAIAKAIREKCEGCKLKRAVDEAFGGERETHNP